MLRDASAMPPRTSPLPRDAPRCLRDACAIHCRSRVKHCYPNGNFSPKSSSCVMFSTKTYPGSTISSKSAQCGGKVAQRSRLREFLGLPGHNSRHSCGGDAETYSRGPIFKSRLGGVLSSARHESFAPCSLATHAECHGLEQICEWQVCVVPKRPQHVLQFG